MLFFRFSVLAAVCLAFTGTGWAKASEEQMQQEITATILQLVAQIPENFAKISALQEAYADADKTVSTATPLPGLHANIHLITLMKESKRRGYGAQYQGTAAVQRVIAAIRALPEVAGPSWTLAGEPAAPGAKWGLDARRDGRAYVNLIVLPDNTALLTVTVFPTPVVDPDEITRQVDELISAAKTDFEGTPRSPYANPSDHPGNRSAPGVMHSNEAWLYVTDQYYPGYTAKWFTTSDGSVHLREVIQAHLDALLTSGHARKVIDTRGPDGSGRLFVLIGAVGAECSTNPEADRPGVLLEIGRVGEKPGYVARANGYAPATYNSNTSAPARTAAAPVTHEHACVRCDGHGSIDTADRYGHYQHVSCPICGGSGRVRN